MLVIYHLCLCAKGCTLSLICVQLHVQVVTGRLLHSFGVKISHNQLIQCFLDQSSDKVVVKPGIDTHIEGMVE